MIHRPIREPSPSRVDEQVRDSLYDLLDSEERIDSSRIDVAVHDGSVTLSGAVNNRRSKRLANLTMRQAAGIHEVHDELRVARSPIVSVHQLNGYLRGELAAVDTFCMALDRLGLSPSARRDLKRCARSHAARAAFLRDEITQREAIPATSSGAWGWFARALEGGARIVGVKTVIALLEHGEARGLARYQASVAKLGPASRDDARTRLLRAQRASYATIAALTRKIDSSHRGD